MHTLTAAKVIRHYGPHDMDALFDGQYIGSFKTRPEAQQALDDHAMRLIEDGLVDLPLTLLTTPPVYTCLGCGKLLPEGRGGHCDACVEWADPAGSSDPDPATGLGSSDSEGDEVQVNALLHMNARTLA